MMPDAVPPSACHLIVLGKPEGEGGKGEGESATSHNAACVVGY